MNARLTKIMLSASLALASMFIASPAHAQSTPEVAPGVTLPSSGMVAVLDTVTGKPTAITIHASEVKSNAHAGSNFARSMVYAGPHSDVELDGVTSALRLQASSPVFFVRLPNEDPDTARNRATIVRLKPTKDSRVVLDFSANVFGGSRKRHADEVAVTKIDVEGGQWVKLSPVKPLEPGEYGITFLPKDQLLFSEIVYDFTIPAK